MRIMFPYSLLTISKLLFPIVSKPAPDASRPSTVTEVPRPELGQSLKALCVVLQVHSDEKMGRGSGSKKQVVDGYIRV